MVEDGDFVIFSIEKFEELFFGLAFVDPVFGLGVEEVEDGLFLSWVRGGVPLLPLIGFITNYFQIIIIV